MQDTPTVAAAKAQHSALYGQIALSHAQVHSSLYKIERQISQIHIFSAGYSEPQCRARSDPSGDTKNGHVLPTGQWYAPSAVINDAWYCIVLHGIAWYCMVLLGIV